MRLTFFKAQGFKSFADPVSFRVNGGLVGIIGPNGCGKSNIVDAIRWALGESRASFLRASMLSDVLYNGGDKRRAVDLCSVELRFDNSSGRGGTMWSSYPEIIVRRELGRDGDQSYKINDKSVRRRDVIDLFRGTGVTPRAYGVIEQGMISNLAEANPEELRAFMEEAAGISHYKDRRKDSERRIQLSRENLQHVVVISDGLRKRSDSLTRQARVVKRYNELSSQLRKLEALLILFKRAVSGQSLSQSVERTSIIETEINTIKKTLEFFSTDIEQSIDKRQKQMTVVDNAREKLIALQKSVDLINRDINNLTEIQKIAHARLEDSYKESTELEEREKTFITRYEHLILELEQLQKNIEENEHNFSQQSDELLVLQEEYERCQTVVDVVRQDMEGVERLLEAALIRQQMTADHLHALDMRLEEGKKALQQHTSLINSGGHDGDFSKEESEILKLRHLLQDDEKKMQSLIEQSEMLDDKVRKLENASAMISTEINTLSKMLQENDWQGDGLERLAHVLQVNAGIWGKALDAVLGSYATALATDDLQKFIEAYDVLPTGYAVIETKEKIVEPKEKNTAMVLPALSSVIEIVVLGRGILSPWLDGVYVAETLEEAITYRHLLRNDERIVTKEGIIFTSHSIFSFGEIQGGYNWEAHYQDLLIRQSEHRTMLEENKNRLNQLRVAISEKKEKMRETSVLLKKQESALTALQIQWNREEERRNAAIEKQKDLIQQIQTMEEERVKTLVTNDELNEKIVVHQESKKKIEMTYTRDQDLLDKALDDLTVYRQGIEGLSTKRRQLEVQEAEDKKQLEHLLAMQSEIKERREKNSIVQRNQKKALEQADAGVMEEQLSAEKEKLVEANQIFNESEEILNRIELWRESKEKEREDLRFKLEEKQGVLHEKRMEERELTLLVNRLNDSLEELGLSAEEIETLQESLENENIEDLNTSIGDIRQKRDKLGAINFAAESELQECQTRLSEIDSQRDDVEQAILELEETIKRIDMETKKRLSDMYQGVNREFSVLVKRFFGGGEASIEMTGTSILESGFEIKLRLPGKRISSLRMLSGGEKAAASLAFVFSIMRLNPPPFCILDEVDAPLDDQRSQRFVDLLEDISQKVQCLVVTHNKGTISTISQLIGVTQEEAGVSKVVSVTLDEALRAVR